MGCKQSAETKALQVVIPRPPAAAGAPKTGSHQTLRLTEGDEGPMKVPAGMAVAQAWYGHPDDVWGSRGVDVTGKVWDLHQRGGEVAAASGLLGDPIPGVKKVLLVRLVNRGQSRPSAEIHRVDEREGKTISIAAGRQLHRAWFGDPAQEWGPRGLDVTGKVWELNRGSQSVAASVDIFGDPAKGVGKVLLVETVPCTRACARTGCQFAAHSEVDHGGFCCSKCKEDGGHSAACQMVPHFNLPWPPERDGPAGVPRPDTAVDGIPTWDEDCEEAARDFFGAMLQAVDSHVCSRSISEVYMILKSREACRKVVCTADEPCRFRHGETDVPLVPQSCGISLTTPLAYTSSHGERHLSQQGLLWFLLKDAYEKLGAEGFKTSCAHQGHALRHFATRVGARMICQRLPDPDELQSFALRRVLDIWGEVVDKSHCQEYLDRSAEHTISKVTGGDYSAPSRRSVKAFDGPEGTIKIARIVKVGIKNPNADFTVKRDTAWHGCQARNLDNWKPETPNTHPQFRVDKFKNILHGAGIYVTPAFEHAVGYAFRMWDSRQPRFSVMYTREGERWNYITIMQMAIYGRGMKGVVDESQKTWNGLPSDGWDENGLEWVVRDPSKAQIYGLLFCFFPDDPPQGGLPLPYPNTAFPHTSSMLKL